MVRPDLDGWCYVITGYLQHCGTRSGWIDLWANLHAELSNCHICIRLCAWNNNWSHEAEFIQRNSSSPPRVVVFGYSWGGGWGAIQFARQLRRRGCAVDAMVLNDPVYRHPYWFGNWRAMVPWSRIAIPPNVRRVDWFRQKRGWPMGHDLKAENPAVTMITDPQVLDVEHGYMDDQPLIIQHCQRIAAAVLSK